MNGVKEVLVLYYDHQDMNEMFEYILDKLRESGCGHSILISKISMSITSPDHQIIVQFIRNNKDGTKYKGRKPTYYYGWGAEFASYMEGHGAKRLNTLDDVVFKLSKGE